MGKEKMSVNYNFVFKKHHIEFEGTRMKIEYDHADYLPMSYLDFYHIFENALPVDGQETIVPMPVVIKAIQKPNADTSKPIDAAALDYVLMTELPEYYVGRIDNNAKIIAYAAMRYAGSDLTQKCIFHCSEDLSYDERDSIFKLMAEKALG